MKALDILIRPIEAILSVAVYLLDRVQRRRALWVVVPVVMLAGCSPQQRLQSLVKRHPELVQTDTVRTVATVIVPADTVFRPVLVRIGDTVRVENERQVVRIVRVPTGSPCDTAAIAADVTGIIKADTVFQRIEIPVERLVPCPEGEKVASWWRVVAIVLALVLGWAIYTKK
jgi:hypothetical protein